MIRLLLLAVAVLAAWWLLMRWRQSPPQWRRGMLSRTALIGGALALVLLAATGRIHWIGALIGALLPILKPLLILALNLFPFLRRFRRTAGGGGSTSGASGQSRVSTEWLEMTLDHASERLSGRVLAGPFAGRELDDLSREELARLRADCRQHDSQGEALLQSYLRHRFGAEADEEPPAEPPSGPMSRAEALAILGLEEGADRDAVVQAHRRLMLRCHPDRGGNDYLAAKLNAAKACLLGERSGRAA